MQELELISKTTPAIVSFNYDEIDKYLDEVLKKYGGLLFTDETVAECKKTMAELKKGKKSLNDFKIKTKKLLTEDITKFEDQCKKLSTKFDTVIDPIGAQADAFEVKRKEDKRTEIQTLINTLTDERFLEYKYSSQLIVTEQMLNKGTKIKVITLELTQQADLLLSQQNIEEANIERIRMKIELSTSVYDVPLSDTHYIDMLEYKDVYEIMQLITHDAEALQKRFKEIELQNAIKAEEAEAEKLAIEAKRVERADRLAAEKADYEARMAEADRVKKERKIELDEALEQEFKRVLDIQQAEAERLEAEQKADELQAKFEKECLGKVVTPSPCSVETNEEPEVTDTETYTVTGTEAQLDALEAYLNVNDYVWI